MGFLHYVLGGDTQSCDRRKKYESGGKKCQSKRAINASDLMQPGENKDFVILHCKGNLISEGISL